MAPLCLNLVFALRPTQLSDGLNCKSCLSSLLQQCPPQCFLHSFCSFLRCPSSCNKSQGASCSSILCSNISMLNLLLSKPGLLNEANNQVSLELVNLTPMWSKESGGCCRACAFLNLHPTAGWTWVPDKLCEIVKDINNMNKTTLMI